MLPAPAPMSYSLGGYIDWEVIENGEVVKSGSHKNLILNAGLDLVAQYAFGELFRYCAVGTGTTEPVAAQEGLINESARTSNYLTGVGNCGTSKTASNVWVFKRTYDFPIGSLNGNFTELGFSPVGVSGPNLFSRTLIQSSGQPVVISINTSQQLRVIYQLTVSLSPTAEVQSSPAINGWPIAPATNVQGSGKLQSLPISVLRNVNTAGVTESSGGELEPGSSSIPVFISNSSSALAALGTSADRAAGFSSTNKIASAVTYTGSSFKEFKMSLSTTEGNHAIRSLGIGSATTHSYAFLFDQNQTKSDLYTLDLFFRMSWGRN